MVRPTNVLLDPPHDWAWCGKRKALELELHLIRRSIFIFLIAHQSVSIFCLYSNGGICFNETYTAFRCHCLYGYYGNTCDMYNPCYTAPCQNGGSCLNISETLYVCTCKQGYHGDECELYNPCFNVSTYNCCCIHIRSLSVHEGRSPVFSLICLSVNAVFTLDTPCSNSRPASPPSQNRSSVQTVFTWEPPPPDLLASGRLDFRLKGLLVLVTLVEDNFFH